jgi:hypothetical protein
MPDRQLAEHDHLLLGLLVAGPAQRIAGHADSRTTKLYDRRGQPSDFYACTKHEINELNRRMALGLVFRFVSQFSELRTNYQIAHEAVLGLDT